MEYTQKTMTRRVSCAGFSSCLLYTSAPPQSGAQGKRKGESVLITISHLTKIFEGKGPRVTALEDVNLEIGKGDIYGIIGMSGAGKSTLLRCLTLLERPTSGQIMLCLLYTSRCARG